MTLKVRSPSSALAKTAKQFAEHTSVHGVSYVADKKVPLFLTFSTFHKFSPGASSQQLALGFRLPSLDGFGHLPFRGIVQPMADETGHHHLEEHSEAGHRDSLSNSHHLRIWALHGEC